MKYSVLLKSIILDVDMHLVMYLKINQPGTFLGPHFIVRVRMGGQNEISVYLKLPPTSLKYPPLIKFY